MPEPAPATITMIQWSRYNRGRWHMMFVQHKYTIETACRVWMKLHPDTTVKTRDVNDPPINGNTCLNCQGSILAGLKKIGAIPANTQEYD